VENRKKMAQIAQAPDFAAYLVGALMAGVLILHNGEI